MTNVLMTEVSFEKQNSERARQNASVSETRPSFEKYSKWRLSDENYLERNPTHLIERQAKNEKNTR